MNQFNKNISFILFLFLFGFASCIDEIDLNIDTDKQFVVVDGYISDRSDTYTIRLTESAIIGVGNDNIFDSISGAKVKVINQNGDAVKFDEDLNEEGSYSAEMIAIPGNQYHVEIVLPGGDIIKSRPAGLLFSPDIDFLNYQLATEEQINDAGNTVDIEFIDVFVNTSVRPGESPFLRWRAEGVYQFQELYPMVLNPRKCYISNNIDLNNIEVYSTEDLSGDQLRDQFVVRTPIDFRFNMAYCFHVSQFSISEEEYNYYTNVQDLINIQGSLFDPPPGKLQNNLFNESNPDQLVLGYFSVSSVNGKRLFITPTEIGKTIPTGCTSNPFRNNPTQCADCTTIINSTLEKPEYWPF